MFDRFRTWRLTRRFRKDLDEITLEITTEDGPHTVTIPFDFSDLSAREVERVGVLSQGADDLTTVACASLFVVASREIDLTDEAFPSFRDGLVPMFSGDTSIFKVA